METEQFYRLMLTPENVTVEACDEGIESPLDVAPQWLVHESNIPTKWCLNFTPCDMNERTPKDCESDELADASCWVKFTFDRALFIRGFGFKTGHDCPERDPMYFKVKFRDSEACAKGFCEDRYHVERHNSEN